MDLHSGFVKPEVLNLEFGQHCLTHYLMIVVLLQTELGVL